MQSIAFSLLAVAATLSTSVRAAPTPNGNTAGAVSARAAYYVCNNNGFRGDCSVDPCAIPWCPDYEDYTYIPKTATPPAQDTVPVTPPVTTTPKSFYVCFNNGFRGDCSIDPCAIAWCPDYEPYTYIPKTTAKRSDPTVCAPGTGYFQSCSNGFRGCCTKDACGQAGWCPDYTPFTYEPVAPTAEVKRSDPTVCAPGTGYFQSCSNGFRGCCTKDACGQAGWCPDFKPSTYEPVSVKRSDPTVCAPGTGYFQSCSNGFRGCCTKDACGQAGWCPDYKFGSYTPVGASSAPAQPPVTGTVKPETPKVDVVVPGSNGVCPPNTGYYQVCGNGFKGCCKKDACSVGFCPA